MTDMFNYRTPTGSSVESADGRSIFEFIVDKIIEGATLERVLHKDLIYVDGEFRQVPIAEWGNFLNSEEKYFVFY